MNTIKLLCPHCGKKLSADEGDIGETGTCPECKRSVPIEVPKPQSAAPFRDSFPAPYVTSDGHRVRSRGELIIDNWLYSRRIAHAYEYMVPIDDDMYCDFYLPDGDVFIEYWGQAEDTNYARRMKAKQRLYRENELNLIELSDRDIERLDDSLPKLLRQFMVSPGLTENGRRTADRRGQNPDIHNPDVLLESMASALGQPAVTMKRREVDDWLARSRISLDSQQRRALFRAWRERRRALRDKQAGNPENWRSSENNQGAPWSTDEDENLRQAIGWGKTPAQIALFHKRTEQAIWARIERLDIQPPESKANHAAHLTANPPRARRR